MRPPFSIVQSVVGVNEVGLQILVTVISHPDDAKRYAEDITNLLADKVGASPDEVAISAPVSSYEGIFVSRS